MLSSDRATATEEITFFWNGLTKAPISDPIQRALKFMLVVGQRPGEVLGLTWDEINLAEATWTLPASRTKAGRTSLVPLTDLAIELLGEPGEFEFIFANPAGIGSNVDDLAIPTKHARGSIRPVAFRRDAFVPIVIGICGILYFYFFQPRVFPWRLIKMSMDADILFHEVLLFCVASSR